MSDEVWKALSDPTRRIILDELAERDGQTLFELCGRLAMRHGLGSSRQAITQHIAVLEAAGLVKTRRQGRYRFHDFNPEGLRTLTDRWLARPGSGHGTGNDDEDGPGRPEEEQA